MKGSVKYWGPRKLWGDVKIYCLDFDDGFSIDIILYNLIYLYIYMCVFEDYIIQIYEIAYFK